MLLLKNGKTVTPPETLPPYIHTRTQTILQNRTNRCNISFFKEKKYFKIFIK